MRLIDADRFLSQIEDQYMEHDITREKYIDLEDRIAQQPTVEERKKGEWIEQTDYVGDTYYDCSSCGESWTTIDGTPWENGMNFCPHCGAKMVRGEEE